MPFLCFLAPHSARISWLLLFLRTLISNNSQARIHQRAKHSPAAVFFFFPYQHVIITPPTPPAVFVRICNMQLVVSRGRERDECTWLHMGIYSVLLSHPTSCGCPWGHSRDAPTTVFTQPPVFNFSLCGARDCSQKSRIMLRERAGWVNYQYIIQPLVWICSAIVSDSRTLTHLCDFPIFL